MNEQMRRSIEFSRATGMRRKQIEKLGSLVERKPGIKYAALEWMRTRPIEGARTHSSNWRKLQAAKVPLPEHGVIPLRSDRIDRPPQRPMVNLRR